IVQQYVRGGDLRGLLKQQGDRLSLRKRVEMIAEISEAVAHAHQQGIIHRDLKPSNILVTDLGKPLVADFGLAIHETQREQEVGQVAGTPVYMSPELVRGETHRLDGRSDVWALGVMLYELLTDLRPFRRDRPEPLRDQILLLDPPPFESPTCTLPRRLQRICLRCLSKSASDRYSTATELGDELRAWLKTTATLGESTSDDGTHAASASGTLSFEIRAGVQSEGTSVRTDRAQQETKERISDSAEAGGVYPRGLESFDQQDQANFLRLLPGPKDQWGVPDVVKFWADWIQNEDADETSYVGLICGPSGCGKSSLCKAAILPRLDDRHLVVMIEASPEQTIESLTNQLRQSIVDLPDNASALEIIEGIREGRWIDPKQRVVFVIDQFEQWLHANAIQRDAPLIQLLRQCDGTTLRTVMLVRNDFFIAVAKFFRELDIPIQEHRNFSTIPLFDRQHAASVLTEFGQALGKWEAGDTGRRTRQAFLREATRRLSGPEGIECVRLAILVETIRSIPWTVETLRGIGGMHEIGSIFLDRCFSRADSNPAFRALERLVGPILRELTPTDETDIKGSSKSIAELAAASGQSKNSETLVAAVDVLDRKLGLIRPVDRLESTETDSQSSAFEDRRFQLTHDFLVHSVRQWLQSKQEASRSGRARLRLARLSQLWSQQQENRYLPSVLEFLSIGWHVRPGRMSHTEKEFFRQSSRTFFRRAALVAASFFAVVLLVVWRVSDERKRNFDARMQLAETRVGRLLSVEPGAVGVAIELLQSDAAASAITLQSFLDQSDTDPEREARLSLALASVESPTLSSLRSVVRNHEAFPWKQFSLVSQVLAQRETLGRQAIELEFANCESVDGKSKLAIWAFQLGNSEPIFTLLARDALPIET
ncbi:MAG: serine/threonine-protein kinase, partial [Planctomycetota bacterium]